MQTESTGTRIPVDFAVDTFHQAHPGIDAHRLLYFAVSASILKQTDKVRFSHQLLQEYFAAYETGEDLRRGVPATKYFPAEDWWTPSGWEETALLLDGIQGDARRVVNWLTPVQPDLAYRVATESGAPCAPSALRVLYEPVIGARRSPIAIAEWGRLIHETDRREGVGLRADGLPDIAWCQVPAGKFIIGADHRSDNPRREEAISYDFKIAKYAITFRQFQAFLDAGTYDDPRWWEDMPDEYQQQPMRPQFNPYHNHPRDRVSWYQAVAFARWLNHRYHEAGLIPETVEIRLPLETEWEYAARSSDGRQYPWGNGYRAGYANLDEQEQGVGPYFLNRTTAVGLYPQGVSPFGAIDMAGNVWEWCLNDYSTPNLLHIYNNNKTKVVRGGSFNDILNGAAATPRTIST